jgi:hypothetical protein
MGPYRGGVKDERASERDAGVEMEKEEAVPVAAEETEPGKEGESGEALVEVEEPPEWLRP